MKNKNKKTEKEVKENMDVGEATHVLKLIEKLSGTIQRSYLNAEQRRFTRETISYINDYLKEMEQHDEDFQNLPENKKDNLRKELIKNDVLLKKNKEEEQVQIQIALKEKGYPLRPFHDVIIEELQVEVKELKIIIESKFVVVNPTFSFQRQPEWIEGQLESAKRKLKVSEKNLNGIIKDVEEAKKLIVEQNERIKARRTQIIEEMEKLGVDVTEFSENPPDYIN